MASRTGCKASGERLMLALRLADGITERTTAAVSPTGRAALAWARALGRNQARVEKLTLLFFRQ